MIKVMLVDDEPIEREGLKMILSKNRSNYQIVADAQNGKEAVEFAFTHKPDLIFMDIKIPEFDGIAAIKKITPKLPDTKFIIVSAFDTFDYARQAMKFGIKEYLLKPSKISEVLEAFDRVVDEIETKKQEIIKRKQINHRLESVSSFVEMEYIVSFMMDHVHEFNQKEWDEWLDLDHKQGFVSVFSFESDKKHPSREEKSRWYQILKRSFQQQNSTSLVGPLTGGFQVPVLTLFSDNQELNREMRGNIVRAIIHQIQNKLEDCHVTVGVGRSVADVNLFSDSYNEAIYALELVYNHPSASYMVYSDQLKQKRAQLVPFEVERELLTTIKKGDIQKGMQMFESYFSSIQQASDFRVSVIQKAMEDFFIVLTRAMKELGYNENIQTNLGQFDTSIQIKEVSKAYLIMIIERIEEWRSNGIQSILLQAKNYMDKYYDSSISLGDVAQKVGISSYYLSKLFKDTFQITFIDYLTNTRLQKAKELLLDQDISLKEIAIMIGYKDPPNYFSRYLKKQTELTLVNIGQNIVNEKTDESKTLKRNRKINQEHN
ncbi:DNA-binding response regulator [Gracilibacillus boraciitolerans JCM 21714]|uniref:DNA-binding response regulator n=1 Tax=Gracilibacillus boraciitolerans JCM 21714 TaxID=1298598 RepID=W4VM66_9BACI|nr:response regulator [Gracilibacillus boraciitolerans]GAE94302.1 DNA-binding response regulator [Gracilibacillus boraciitolerans JCM 21714]